MMATATRGVFAELALVVLVDKSVEEREDLPFDFFISNPIYLAARAMAISSLLA